MLNWLKKHRDRKQAEAQQKGSLSTILLILRAILFVASFFEGRKK